MRTTSFSFKYSTIDAARFADATPGIYSVSWPTPLPINLLSFNVAKSGLRSDLTWTTSSEINSSHFIIERSPDGNIWSGIGKVSAHENSNYAIDYNFIDAQPFNDQNFYRLKSFDLDGQFHYSQIRMLVFGEGAVVCNIYPNITLNSFNIETNSTGNAAYHIYDIAGTVVLSGEFTRSIKISDLSAGMYFVSVIVAEQDFTIKVLVTR